MQLLQSFCIHSFTISAPFEWLQSWSDHYPDHCLKVIWLREPVNALLPTGVFAKDLLLYHLISRSSAVQSAEKVKDNKY